MSSSVIINGVEYISTSRASEITRYTKDYIGQLSREGKILSLKDGRIWYIGKDSILDYKKAIENSVPYYVSNSAKRKSSVSTLGLSALVSIIVFLISLTVYSIFGSIWNFGNTTLTTLEGGGSAGALNGLVVVESAGDAVKNLKTAEMVKQSFSDEVDVKADADTNTGIVTPHFVSATSSEYFYVMVPVDQ